MKELGVSFPFLQPFNPGFLLPIKAFLSFPSFKLLHKIPFLVFHFLAPSFLHSLSVDAFQLHQKVFLILEDVSKFLPVPFSDFHLQGFKFLLESEHNGSWGGDKLLPPLPHQVLEVFVFHPEAFKSKGFASWGSRSIPEETDGPVIRTISREDGGQEIPRTIHNGLRDQESIQT